METKRFYQEQNRIVAEVEWLQVWNENPRAISEQDFDQLKKDVQGEQFKPLLITDEGIVLGGNMRLRAYKELGIKKVWVSVVSFREDEEKKVVAYVNGKQDHRFASKYDAMVHYSIKDNETRGFYQEELLAEQLSKVALPLESYKLTMVDGINLSEILKKYSPEEDVIEDEAPEVSQEEPKSKLGEVYQLGRHRLMCGDSTKIEDVEKLMNGNKADMVFTDPPYGVGRDGGFGGFGGFGKPIARRTYEDKWDKEKVNADAFNNLLTVTNRAIIFGGNFYTDVLPVSGHWIVWDKKQTMPTFGDCELAWTNIDRKSVKKYEIVYNGLIGKEKENRAHPTQKPVQLPFEILRDYTEDGERILDLFGGSGSTLIACEQLNRTCYMMELDPKYCDVIRKRYAKFIGKEEDWENTTPKV